MIRIRFHSRVPVPRRFAWECYTADGMFERLTPPWQEVQVVDGTGGVAPGSWRHLRIAAGPATVDWIALHGSWKPGFYFTDEQIEGPFARWSHVHRFADDGDAASVLSDDITLRLPFEHLTEPLADRLVRTQLRRMFRYRHRRAFHDLTRHFELREYPRLSIRLAGTAAYKRHVAAFLTIAGHTVLGQADGPADATVVLADAAAEVRHILEESPETEVLVVVAPPGESGLEREVKTRGRVVRIYVPAVMWGAGGPLRQLIAAARWGVEPVVPATPDPLRWVALDDLTAIVRRAVLLDEMRGEYVIAAPNVLTGEAVRSLVRRLAGRPLLPAAPARHAGLLGDDAVWLRMAMASGRARDIRESGHRFLYASLQELLLVESGHI